jgi:hypothetical protein
MRNAVRDANTGLMIASIGTLDSNIRAGLASPRLAAAALAGFSAIAILLTGIGIYAVLAFSVARRSAELSIRMALGAAPAPAAAWSPLCSGAGSGRRLPDSRQALQRGSLSRTVAPGLCWKNSQYTDRVQRASSRAVILEKRLVSARFSSYTRP